MTSEEITHLDPCTFAIVRSSDGYVMNVLAGSHDEESIIRMNHTVEGSTYVVDCCVYGSCGVGSLWDGYEFRPPRPALSWRWDSTNAKWLPPVKYPGGPFGDGKNYYWAEDIMDWIEIGEVAVPE